MSSPSAVPQEASGLGALLAQDVTSQGFTLTEDQLNQLSEASAQPASPDRTWTGMTRQMMEVSCAFFANEVLTGPIEAPYLGRFICADHHERWDEILVTNDRICVEAPRGHGKSYFWSFAVPIWKACFNPNKVTYIFSATLPQAKRLLEDIQKEIEENPKLAWLLPKKKRKWSATRIELSNGHKIYARGYGSKVRGAHPHTIIVDDGLNDEDAYSETVRNKNIEYFYTAITNMIEPSGQIIVVGTPFHGGDLYGLLEKNPSYIFRRFPARDPKTNAALWPERFSAKRLARIAIEIGSIRFAREFLCQPVSDEMSIFPEYLFRGAPTEMLGVKLGLPGKWWDAMGITSRYIGVDFALSSSVKADYTVIFVLGVDSVGNRYVCDIQRKHGLHYQQQISLINAVARKYNPQMIYLEANQMQRIFGDELIRTTDLPIKKFVTTGNGKQKIKHPKNTSTSMNKNSLEGGVPSLRVLLENQKFRIPRGDTSSVEKTDQWIEEMKSFTWLDGKLQGVGAHDDTVMALWIADQAVRAGGFSASFGASEDEEQTLDELIAEQAMGVDDEEEDEDDEEVNVNLIDTDSYGDDGLGNWQALPGFHR